LEDEKADFFEPFFEEGGRYMKFVSESSDGNVDAADRVKVGKEYKIGVVVSVHKDALRKDLEAAGIIRGLSSGF
jgi:sRNA-binding protein